MADVTNTALRLVVYRSIVGALRLPEEMTGLVALQSIIDGLDISAVAATGTDDAAGPPSDLRQVTVLGEVHVRTLLMASEVIFADPVQAERTQEGCVRFSFVAPGSTTPRRYRCQPDMALDLPGLSSGERARIEAGLQPAYTSIHYRDPGYTQLGISCPDEIADRGRGRFRDGGVVLPAQPATRGQPAHPPRRVPAVRPRARR